MWRSTIHCLIGASVEKTSGTLKSLGMGSVVNLQVSSFCLGSKSLHGSTRLRGVVICRLELNSSLLLSLEFILVEFVKVGFIFCHVVTNIS